MNEALHTWKIAEHFEQPRNEELLEALSSGTNALCLHLRQSMSEDEVSQLFEEIDLSMIDLYVSGNKNTIELLTTKVTKAANDGHGFPKTDSGQIYTINAEVKGEDFKNELIDFLQLAKNNDHKNITIKYLLGNHYLQNIYELRAIRLLWEHLKISKSSDHELTILAATKNYAADTLFEEDIVYASLHLMSAIIGTADCILLHISPKEEHADLFKRRITRNLHHLAHYEAKMFMVEDPLKGSYYIEDKTKQLAEEIWTKFTA